MEPSRDGDQQLFQRAVPGNVMGGNELSNRVLNYAERNVHNAFEFAHRFVQVKGVEDLVKRPSSSSRRCRR
jgi:hypothetical protein